MNSSIASLSSLIAPPLLGAWLARASAAIRRSFEDAGRARAQRHLLDFAAQCQGLQPELAKELRAAADHSAAA